MLRRLLPATIRGFFVVDFPFSSGMTARSVQIYRPLFILCYHHQLPPNKLQEQQKGATVNLLHWQVGAVRITRVQELEAPGMRFIVPQATIENLATIPWLTPFLAPIGRCRGQCSCPASWRWTGGASSSIPVSVMTKNGGFRRGTNARGLFSTHLTAAGCPPESIDTVICTHLHTDHVGWNTRLVNEQWVPTFPQARYLMARPEWQHWSKTEDHWTQIVMADSVRPVFDAGLVDLVETDHVVHTTPFAWSHPGAYPWPCLGAHHVRGCRSRHYGGFRAPSVPVCPPGLGLISDADAVQADQTRKAFMARYADTPTLIIGTHFAGPTAGRLVRDGDVYRLEV